MTVRQDRLEAERARWADAGLLHTRDQRFMQIEMDITTRCNIRCRMCYFSFDRYFYGKPVYFPLEQFTRIAREVFPYVHTLTLSLGSEPLTSPHFKQFLRLASAAGVPNITFYTNGLLMGPSVTEAILSSGVTNVAISIDGATKATYEHIRVGGDFDRLMANVQWLVSRRRAGGFTRPVLRFGVVMMRSNVHEIADIVSLAAANGVAEVNLCHMVVYDGLDTAAESLVHDKARSNDAIRAALARAADVGVTIVSHPGLFALDEEPAPPATAPFLPTPYCPFPFFHVSMNAGGHVIPCPFSHGEAPYGTVSDERSLLDIWLGEEFTVLRQRILNHDPPAMCRRCPYLAQHYPNHAELFAARTTT